MILFIKHIDIEGPDTLDTFFKDKGFSTQTIEFQNGDRLPDDFDTMDAVISLGGPMSVYDEDKYPFLKDEDQFIRQIISKEIPFIGICLGSQLLAKACGAKVNKSPTKEIGFLPVKLVDDALFKGIGETISAFHWHEDMFELPSGAKLLASSQGCPHQAYKVGTSAYGLQFHIEVTEATIQKWINAYFSKNNPDHAQQEINIIEDYRSKKDQFHNVADMICNNFLKTINNYRYDQNSSSTN